MARYDGTAGLAARALAARALALDHTCQRTASIKYIVVMTMHLRKHSTDAHTWPKLEVRAMVAWVLMTALVVG